MKRLIERAVVVAQLIEWSLPIQRSAIRNQPSEKFILNIYCQLFLKDENKEKEAVEWPNFLKKVN